MKSRTSENIQQRINAMVNKCNYYVGTVLRDCVDETLDAINLACEMIHLEAALVNRIHESLIARLENISFMKAYLAKEFTTINRLESDIDMNSFRRFMLKHIPSFAKPETFINEALGLSDRKNELLRQIREVKTEVNKYGGSNKKDVLIRFNSEIDQIIKSVEGKSYFEAVADTNDLVRKAVRHVQDAETNYYVGMRFFSVSRMANSSLQPRINAANKMVDAMLSTDNAFQPLETKQHARFQQPMRMGNRA